MTTQHAAPDTNATQIVSAEPLAPRTFHKAMTAPTQTGSSKIATSSLHHFSTRRFFF